MKKQSKILVWDWPIRVFHWFFAVTILLSLGIAFLGEHTSIFPWHMLFGLCAGFLLVLRMIMGFFRSKPYSFREQLISLKQLPSYVRSLRRHELSHFSGHNPLAWLVYVFMFFCLAMTVFTGVNMHAEWAEESHSVFAWALAATIGLHLIGIGIHTYRFREPVAGAMLHGRKASSEAGDHRSSSPIMGGLLLVLTILFMGQLFSNYQAGSERVRLPWLGADVRLGEGEDAHGEKSNGHHEEANEHKHREKKDHHGHDDGHDD